MKKINPIYNNCEKWKPSKGALYSKEKRCGDCYYNLFAYCWFDDVTLPPEFDSSHVITLALDGVDWARQRLHKMLEGEVRENG